jgi:hypothetical protein
VKTVTFRNTVAALSVVALFFVGQIVSKGSQTPETLARQVEPTREQLINRVTQPYNRMVFMCDYVAQYSYLVPQEGLPSKCAHLRAAGSEAIARMKTTKDLNSLSRAVDQFEIEIASPLQNMEASYATVRRIMGEARGQR